MIGQCTNVGMTNVGWRFYLVFVVGNFTNAVFFWSFLPETKKLPLEEMEVLFSQSPTFVGNRDFSTYSRPAIQEIVENIERKETHISYTEKVGNGE